MNLRGLSHKLYHNEKCFLCSEPETLTEEHVIPELLGAQLTAGIYYKNCNDKLGAQVDSEPKKRLGYFGTALQINGPMGNNQPYTVSVVNEGKKPTFNGRVFKCKKPLATTDHVFRCLTPHLMHI